MNISQLAFVAVAACRQNPSTNEATGSATTQPVKHVVDASPDATGAGSSVPVDFTQTDFCLSFVKKVQACVATPEFNAGLDEGASRADKKVNAKLLAQTKKWMYSPSDVCGTFFQFAFSHPGFLDHASMLSEASLASCKVLGTAIKNAGGLVGGEIGR